MKGVSRLARKPIVPGKVQVSVVDGIVTVKGSKATLAKRVHPSIRINVDTDGVTVSVNDRSRLARALVGTYAAHLKNMVQGVENPYMRKLVLDGVGYRMEVKGSQVVLTVGFSHPVTLAIPEGVTAAVEKNIMTLTSSDKEALGQFAANIRRVKPPEPYLGKGIRYEGEVVRRKQGKRAT